MHLPTKAAKYEAIKGIVLGAVDDDTFTYTDLLLCDEALYTVAFEVLDGTVTNSSNQPQPGAHQAIQGDPLRLVCLDTPEKVAEDNSDKPKHLHRTLDTVRYSEWYEPRIPGTNKRGKPIKRAVDLGLDGMVADHYPDRTARGLLVRHGWPNRNVKSRSGSVGHLVEWRWLERAAQAAGDAPEDKEIRDLYQTLKARFDAKPATAPAPATKRQERAPGGAGATP
jgi:hypothetical protein